MDNSSRIQGTLICCAAVLTGAVFLFGLAAQHWWAVAVPVGLLLALVLGLVFWVGFTIATINVDAEAAPESQTPAAPEANSNGAG